MKIKCFEEANPFDVKHSNELRRGSLKCAVNNKMATVLIKKLLKKGKNSSYLINLKDYLWIVREYAVCAAQPNYMFFNKGFDDEEEKAKIMMDMKVYENFITEEEENSLLQELEPYLKRMRYERSHWDNAIKGYRETERRSWNPSNVEIINRVQKLAFKENSMPLKHVHVLDLEENGVIMPHIDSIKFCGSTIAGVSLLSDSVMRLVHDKEKTKIVDVLLKRYSLYIMTGSARYNYTHEILGNDNSKFNQEIIKKSRRISVICRNEP